MTKKIGAVWKHQKDGKTFLTGDLDLIICKLKIGLFKRENKKNQNEPDYDVVLLEDMPQKKEIIKTEKLQSDL